MKVALSRMKEVLKKFNKLGFTIDDVYKIAKRERVNIVFYAMGDGVKGYYQTERKRVYRKKYICLNEKTSKDEILSVLLHELAHHFLHVSPAVSRQTFFCRAVQLTNSKQDAEADAVALILEIPQAKMFELMDTNFEDITEFTPEKLKKRLWVYRNHGE